MITRTILVLTCLAVAGCAGNPYGDSVRPRNGDSPPGDLTHGKAGALMRVAKVTGESGNHSAAAAMYRQAHALDTERPEPLNGLGAMLMRLGSYDEAREAYRKSVALKATPEALVGLANALIAVGQPALAISNLERAIEIRETWQAFNAAGIAHDLLGEHAIAQAFYQSGLSVDAGNLSIRNNLGLSLAVSGSHDKAIEVLRSAASAKGATARTRLNLALVYGLAGEESAAAEMARNDLDEASVQQNLAYYATLRALKDSVQIMRAVGGYSSVNFDSASAGGDEAPGGNAVPETAPR